MIVVATGLLRPDGHTGGAPVLHSAVKKSPSGMHKCFPSFAPTSSGALIVAVKSPATTAHVFAALLIAVARRVVSASDP